jgi:hypothetical protein
MAALVAAIHADPHKASRDSEGKQMLSMSCVRRYRPFLLLRLRLVDGRDKRGHDGQRTDYAPRINLLKSETGGTHIVAGRINPRLGASPCEEGPSRGLFEKV